MSALSAMTWEEYLYALQRGNDYQAAAIRATGRTHPCSVCQRDVAVIEMKLPRLSSRGVVNVWAPEGAEAHSRACHQAYDARIKRDTDALDLDLWAS